MRLAPTILLPIVVALTACAAHTPQPAAVAPAPVSADPSPPQAAPLETNVVSVFMYQFHLPYGATSQSEAFWKLADEDAVPVDDYDVLYRNGIRVGRADFGAWESFLRLIDRTTTTVETGRFTGLSNAQGLEVDMTPTLAEQVLFVFDPDHGLTGRIYNQSVDRFSFEFQWERHQSDTIRVKIVPIVAALRSRIDDMLDTDPPEIRFRKNETLYDLGLAADIGPRDLLIIGPSPRAEDPMRVGHQFLVQDMATQQKELLLVLCRQPLPFARVRPYRAATAPSH